MANKIFGLAVLAAAVGVAYAISKKQPAQAVQQSDVWNWGFDPRYMAGNYQIPTEVVSTDDNGGTVGIVEHTIGVGPFHVPRNAREPRARVEADYPTFTGGTFLHPEVLPPTRMYHIQSGVVSPPNQYIPELPRLTRVTGGRFVNPGFLPPEREVFIQRMGSLRRNEEE